MGQHLALAPQHPLPIPAQAVRQKRRLTQVGLFPAQQLIIAAASLLGLFVQQLPTLADEAANSPRYCWLARPLWLLLEAFMLIRYQAATSHGLSFSSSLGFMVERNYFQKTITTSLFLMALCLPAVKLL